MRNAVTGVDGSSLPSREGVQADARRSYTVARFSRLVNERRSNVHSITRTVEHSRSQPLRRPRLALVRLCPRQQWQLRCQEGRWSPVNCAAPSRTSCSATPWSTAWATPTSARRCCRPGLGHRACDETRSPTRGCPTPTSFPTKPCGDWCARGTGARGSAHVFRALNRSAGGCVAGRAPGVPSRGLGQQAPGASRLRAPAAEVSGTLGGGGGGGGAVG